jgi:trk system potassium uptake protein
MSGIHPLGYILGFMLAILGIAMALPGLLDLIEGGPDGAVFFACAGLTVFMGGLLLFADQGEAKELNVRQAFLLTVASWIGLSAFAALPFVFSSAQLSYTDAFFETVSGFTTTGSTVIVNLHLQSRAVLLWRGLLQGLGGIGIIAMAIAILPFLKVGGMQLFRAESSDRSEKVLPRPGQIATSLFSVYIVLVLICTLLFWLVEMSWLDALVHAMAALSTGGFANYDNSFETFRNPATHWIGTLFMLIGGLPFTLYVRACQGDPMALLKSSQVRSYVAILAICSLAIALSLIVNKGVGVLDALRLATFNTVSIATTTGFVLTDYGIWGGLTIGILFFLTFLGGCTGSTAGAIKMFRFQVLWIMLRKQLKLLVQPSGVFPERYDGRLLPDDVTRSVISFVFAYFATYAALALGLFLLDLDFVTALSGAATAIGNVGPGFGPIIGPAGNFRPLPDAAKWMLSFGMLFGRLELFTFLVLATPEFWRR